MTLRVVTPPAQMVSTADAKLHLRVDHSDDDARIASLIVAATDAIEAATQRRFMTQVLEWVLPCWRYPMRLPVAPIVAGDLSVAYADEVLGETDLDPTSYVVRPQGETLAVCPIEGLVWPLLDPDADELVVVTFTAGADAAPITAVEACKLLVEYYYESRDWPLAPSGLPRTVESLIAPLRWS